MAGTRSNIARWRRVKHMALVLCVQSVFVWIGLCAIVARIEIGRDGTLLAARGMLTYEYAPLPPLTSGRLVNSLSLGDVVYRQWGKPALWPAWRRTPAALPATPGGYVIGIPLWLLPLTFGSLAWYANTRIERLRQGTCTKCGYDTRGLAAGACCPECGTAYSV